MARSGHVKKMARRGDARAASARDDGLVHSRWVDGLLIRPLRDGDVATVAELFSRLGPASRVKRFGGAKPRLTERELDELARVDATHHVLVAYVPGEPSPAGIGRLVRTGAAAEVAFEVADACQGRGIGSLLARELAADARAAGVRELHATVCCDNPPALSLLRRVGTSFRVTWRGGEREAVVGLEG
jgi:ribosomal protein S18 acetylase RimI-like enzyme